MTDKELRRLRRHDLLEIMVAQGRENAQLRQQLQETEESLTLLEANYERLKKRLDDKDEKIRGLRQTLEDERNERRIISDEAGNIAEAALRMNKFFDAAQETAELYLHNVRKNCEEKEAELDALAAEAQARRQELEQEFAEKQAQLDSRIEELEAEKAERDARIAELTSQLTADSQSEMPEESREGTSEPEENREGAPEPNGEPEHKIEKPEETSESDTDQPQPSQPVQED